MGAQITDGKINMRGKFVFPAKTKRADYILYLNKNNPIAIVKAEDNNHTIYHGFQQAMTYAERLDLTFAYSSNGDGLLSMIFLQEKKGRLLLMNSLQKN